MGAAFCSLYCKIHYIKVRYIEVWVYYNTWTCVSKASLLLMPNERLHTGQIKLVAKWWSTWISNSRTSSSSKVSSQMGHFNLQSMKKKIFLVKLIYLISRVFLFFWSNLDSIRDSSLVKVRPSSVKTMLLWICSTTFSGSKLALQLAIFPRALEK